MRRIPLRARDGSVRAYALVDDEDHAWASAIRWSLSSGGYARRREPHGYLHRLIGERILGRPLRFDEQVHHRHEHKLDSRRSELSVETALTHKAQHHEHPGVRYDSSHGRRKRWLARPTINGRKVYLGRFLHEPEALEACNVAVA